MQGIVVADFGKQYAVSVDGKVFTAHPRKKNNRPVVGDAVSLEISAGADANAQAVIVATLARKNLLYRSEAHKQKSFAGNLDAVAYLYAAEPAPHFLHCAKALFASHAAGIPLWLIHNKADLTPTAPLNSFSAAAALFDTPQFALSAKEGAGLAAFRQAISGKRILLLGQSGVGKSSLLNALIPNAKAQTNTLSAALASGRHTTTFTQLYQGDDFELIDSPGFENFGLAHLPQDAFIKALPMLAPLTENCRYYNCTHCHEPQCGVITACAGNAPLTQWLAAYQAAYTQYYSH